MPIRTSGIEIQGLLKNARDHEIIKGILIGILQMANAIFISELRCKMRMCIVLHSSPQNLIRLWPACGGDTAEAFSGKRH